MKSNWDWTISVAENAWIEVTPSAGEADKEYVMTVKATSNLSLDERSASFSIISDEVLGTKAVKEIFVTQESLAEGGPLEGLDAPVKWFFNGASGTDYTVPKEQFEQNNKLMASSGVGYISYFHTFNSDGSLHPNSTRMIGGTGQPYVTGAWKGDYWLFEVPVKNFKSGTRFVYGSHTYLRHRTEVLEPAIYGRYELETGDRHADRNRQRGTDHLHASGTDGQHADRRDDDLRTRH